MPGDIHNPALDIRLAVAGLLGADFWERFGHLSYAEMAEAPELAEHRAALLQAAADFEAESRR